MTKITEEDIKCLFSAIRLLEEEGYNRKTIEPKKRLLEKLKSLNSSQPKDAEGELNKEEVKEKLEHIMEYWNGSRNDEAMFDALNHILETVNLILAQNYYLISWRAWCIKHSDNKKAKTVPFE